jgi:hypothetical protein
MEKKLSEEEHMKWAIVHRGLLEKRNALRKRNREEKEEKYGPTKAYLEPILSDPSNFEEDGDELVCYISLIIHCELDKDVAMLVARDLGFRASVTDHNRLAITPSHLYSFRP